VTISAFFKPASALIAVTAAAAVLLGYVHNVTLKPIAEQRQIAETEAIGAIFGTAPDTAKEMSVPENSPITRALRVYAGGALLGYAVFTSPIGYSGPVSMVVGIDPAGAVKGVKILRHTETPGLGANADSPAFTDQFIGKSGELRVAKAESGGNDIQAISSATITSGAVTRGVNDALRFCGQTVTD